MHSFIRTPLLALSVLAVLGNMLHLKSAGLDLYGWRVSENKFHTPLPKPSSNNESRRTLHMIQCVFGDNPFFINEWEVSLKSIIYNTPLDSDLHVHVFTNGVGTGAVRNKILDEAKLEGTRWRNKITITVTNVEPHIEHLLGFLKGLLVDPKLQNTTWMDKRLGIGAFFRLFAYKYMMEYADVAAAHDDDPLNEQIRQNSLRQAVYLDVDVVVITNLNDVISTMDGVVDKYNEGRQGQNRSVEEEDLIPQVGPLWIIGQGNTGFLGMNALEFDKFWEAAKRCDRIRADSWPKKNDQWLTQHVMKCFAQIWAAQPEMSPWSVHIGHGYRAEPQKLMREQRAGMLHLQNPDVKNWFEGTYHQGGMNETGYNEGYVGHFCKRGRGCNHEDANDMKDVANTWGLADYYLRISWDWTIYQAGVSRIKPTEDGQLIELVFRNVTSPGNSSALRFFRQ